MRLIRKLTRKGFCNFNNVLMSRIAFQCYNDTFSRVARDQDKGNHGNKAYYQSRNSIPIIWAYFALWEKLYFTDRF